MPGRRRSLQESALGRIPPPIRVIHGKWHPSQVLNLQTDRRRERGRTLRRTRHDMGVVRHMCDRIAMMRAGKIMEMGTRKEVLGSPREEYTGTLLAVVPEACA